MEEVYRFLKQCGTYYLATQDGEQPRVRPFGTINLFEGKLYLQDLGSTYGTFLSDGRKLSPSQAVELREGDSFSLGSQRERFIVTGRGGM